jgi:hypothetical protein
MGRVSTNYNYDRAKIISGRVSINGRFWARKGICDYMACIGADRRLRLQVGQIRDFVVIPYIHKDIENKRGRCRPATLQGVLIFARIRQYNPRPQREENMWVAQKKPAYRLATQAVPLNGLCSFLHAAAERTGRRGFVNLIQVAVAYVKE